MKFLAVLALAGAVIAYTPCTGLSENAVCCSVDVLGLLDLDCKHRKFCFVSLLIYLLTLIEFSR